MGLENSIQVFFKIFKNFIALFACLILTTPACSYYNAMLKTAPARDIDTSVTYTIIRVGGAYYHDYSTFALIAPETGKYKFQIYRPDFDYRVSKGLTAKQAFSEAEAYVAAQPNFMTSHTSSVIGPEGRPIAYEVRPLYQQIVFGQSDLLIVNYLLKHDNVIEVRVDVEDVVKRHERGDDRRSFRRR